MGLDLAELRYFFCDIFLPCENTANQQPGQPINVSLSSSALQNTRRLLQQLSLFSSVNSTIWLRSVPIYYVQLTCNHTIYPLLYWKAFNFAGATRQIAITWTYEANFIPPGQVVPAVYGRCPGWSELPFFLLPAVISKRIRGFSKSTSRLAKTIIGPYNRPLRKRVLEQN